MQYFNTRKKITSLKVLNSAHTTCTAYITAYNMLLKIQCCWSQFQYWSVNT